MYAQIDKPKENKSRAVANSVTQKKRNVKQSFGFVDNRPEAVSQRKLQIQIDTYSNAIQRATGTEIEAANAQLKKGVNIIQRVTSIDHETTQFDTENQQIANFPVGTRMRAILDPAYPVLGSATSNGATPLLRQICNMFNPNLEQTHLLNADIGGFGVYENLYPMTPRANRLHFNNVERHVKGALSGAANNMAQGLPANDNQRQGIYYEVRVNGQHTRTGLANGISMRCEAYYIDNVENNSVPDIENRIANATITSQPNTQNEQVPDWAGWAQSPQNWRHTIGQVGPDVTQNQAQYVNRREGVATGRNIHNNVFSRTTIGQSWFDVRVNRVSVNGQFSNNIQNVEPANASQGAAQTAQTIGFDDGRYGIEPLAEYTTSLWANDYQVAYQNGYQTVQQEVYDTAVAAGENLEHYINGYDQGSLLRDRYEEGFGQGLENSRADLWQAGYDDGYEGNEYNCPDFGPAFTEFTDEYLNGFSSGGNDVVRENMMDIE